jgi:hypothetical protein
MPALVILALWTANTAAFASPRHVQCLFDLTIEELMEIRIGAELRLNYWTQAENHSPDADWHDQPAGLDGGGGPNSPGSHALHGSQATEANRPAFTWNN